MTDQHDSESATHVPTGYAIEYGLVRMQILTRGLATVLRIEGEIDRSDVDVVERAIERLLRLETPLILDLSRLDFLAVAGYQMLALLSDECRQTGIPMPIVGGRATAWLRRVRGAEVDVWTVNSVAEAIELISELTCERGSSLPLRSAPTSGAAPLAG